MKKTANPENLQKCQKSQKITKNRVFRGGSKNDTFLTFFKSLGPDASPGNKK
jgi:hypothetical protein